MECKLYRGWKLIPLPYFHRILLRNLKEKSQHFANNCMQVFLELIKYINTNNTTKLRKINEGKSTC